MITIQTFNRAGWPANSPIELADDPAAAILTAARDYQEEKRVGLHGDILAAPVGGKRTIDQVNEMRSAFRAPRTSALWLTIGRDKYNMDAGSTAIPSLTSPHLTGYCMDISDNGFLAWLIVNGARYGLRRTLVKENDLRHFQYFPGTATAALNVTDVTKRTDSDMYCIGLDQGKPTAVSFSIGVGILQRHSQARQQELAAAQAQQPGGCYWYDDDDFARTMWNHGLGEFTVAQARALTDNGHLVAKAIYGNGAASPPNQNLSTVLTAIAALDKQADDYQAQLEATLTKGLTISGTAKPA